MTNLSREDIDVLRITVRQGPVRAKNVSEAVAWSENTSSGRSKIRYRWDKLEKKGLVQSEYIEEEAQGSQNPPREVEATDLGREQYEEYTDEDDYHPKTQEERIKKLEAKYKQIQEKYVVVKQSYYDLHSRLEELEETLEGVDDVDGELDDLDEEIRNIKNSIEGGDSITDELVFSDD